jgi:uncharacterized protein (TIGR00730 family)
VNIDATRDHHGQTDEERVQGIASELATGYRVLRGVGPSVTVFGSARTPPEHPDYALARGIGRLLGEAGYAIVTGAGGGLMEAANRGARDAGAVSVGCSIELPFEHVNPFIDVQVHFRHFFARKDVFLRFAEAIVVCPGGYGTLDELFEVLALLQTGKLALLPTILAGTGEWEGLLDWVRDRALADGRIDPGDLDFVERARSAEEVRGIVLRGRDGAG